MNWGKVLIVLLCKTVDDLLLVGENDADHHVAETHHQSFVLGTLAQAPGKIRFQDLNLVQHDDLSINVDGHDRLKDVETYYSSRERRRQGGKELKKVEARAFRCLNSSIGRLSLHASAFCVVASSLLQQGLHGACIKDIVHQTNLACDIKPKGTLTNYPWPTKEFHPVSALVYSNADRQWENAQLSYIMGVLIRKLQQNSVCCLLRWQTHRYACHVRSTGAAEILLCDKAIDQDES